MAATGMLMIPVNVQFYREMTDEAAATWEDVWEEMKKEISDMLESANWLKVCQGIVIGGSAIVEEEPDRIEKDDKQMSLLR